MTTATRREEWRGRANCLGLEPDLFFEPEHEEMAKAICKHCEVRHECLVSWLHMPDDLQRHGVWGGLGQAELREIRARKRTGTVVRTKEEQNA